VLYETGVVTPVAPVVVLDAPGRVEAVRPDPAQIRRLPVSRVLVTATGSAHTALGPPWAARLGRPRLSAVPASPRRGRLAVAVEDERICVGGQAVTITRGERLAEP
jgi:hypothetical protein